MRRNSFSLLLLCLVLAPIAGCGKATPAADATEEAPPVSVELVKAERRPIRHLLQVTGSFVATQGGAARLSPATSGRVVKVLVGEGDKVTKGQLLAQIETTVQAAQLDAANQASMAAGHQADEANIISQAAQADQAANVRAAEQAVESARNERDAAIVQAEADYKVADADLRKTKAGARPQEIAQAHLATVQAQVTRDRAKRELDRDKALSQEGYVARRDLEDAQAAFDTSEAALASAKASENLVNAGARPEELQSAELRAKAAAAGVVNAKRSGELKVAQAANTLNQVKQASLQVDAKVREAAASQNIARQRNAESAVAFAQASQTEVRAPFDGQITKRLLNPGDAADATTPILEMNATNGVDFVAGVSLSDASNIHAGMESEIVLADGKSVPARVLSVSPGDSATGLSNVRLATGAHAVIGSFCRANIILARNPSAIAVPKEALLDRDGVTAVFIASGDVAKMVSVAPGPEDEGWIEIDRGVKVGDSLVKVGQFELSDGAKIQEEAKAGVEEKP